MQTQVKSQFRMNLLKLPRNVRQMKAEDSYYNENDDYQAITDKLNLTVECAKVAMSVDKLVSNEVNTNVKSKAEKKGMSKSTKKKSTILSQGPDLASTGLRRSSRKKTSQLSWISSTPLASSTWTAAALGMLSYYILILLNDEKILILQDVALLKQHEPKAGMLHKLPLTLV